MKIKLLTFKLNKDLCKDFSNAIFSNQYSEANELGFILKSSSESRLSGSFNETIKKEVTHYSPLGDKVSYTSISFHTFEFEILWSQSVIILYDAGRRVKPFLDLLSELANFKIAFTLINIDALAFYNKLKIDFNCTQINAVLYKKIPLSNKSLIDFLIQGDEDVLEHLSIFNKIDNYNLSYLKFNVLIEAYNVKVCVFQKATIHLDCDSPPALLRKLLNDFVPLLNII